MSCRTIGTNKPTKTEDGEFVEFSMPLPTLKNESGDCSFCNGTRLFLLTIFLNLIV